jgi:hypothetical protein
MFMKGPADKKFISQGSHGIVITTKIGGTVGRRYKFGCRPIREKRKKGLFVAAVIMMVQGKELLSSTTNSPVTFLLLSTVLLWIGSRVFSKARAAFFTELSRVPGPFICRFTDLADTYYALTGHRSEWIHSVHAKYGQWQFTP